MVRLTQHLFTLLAAFSVILGAAANPIASTTTMDVSPRRDTSGGLMTRAQVTSGTLCESVAIIIKIGGRKYVSWSVIRFRYPGLPLHQTILDNICLCTVNGVIVGSVFPFR